MALFLWRVRALGHRRRTHARVGRVRVHAGGAVHQGAAGRVRAGEGCVMDAK